ncbi:hypothetical protein BT93_J1501 [Corymbia citriodora subsp. variegata]|nr:hypothetical protein BT93_J1501 [Corymbia citriodora subsp. variegata]
MTHKRTAPPASLSLSPFSPLEKWNSTPPSAGGCGLRGFHRGEARSRSPSSRSCSASLPSPSRRSPDNDAGGGATPATSTAPSKLAPAAAASTTPAGRCRRDEEEASGVVRQNVRNLSFCLFRSCFFIFRAVVKIEIKIGCDEAHA